MSNGLPVDAVALRDEVKTKYRSVAIDPHGAVDIRQRLPPSGLLTRHNRPSD
jgi:hypothetical protein